MDEDILPRVVIFPPRRLTAVWAGRGCGDVLRVVAVHEGGFAWTLLGLVILALVLVLVALVMANAALRKARRVDRAVRSLPPVGFPAEAQPAAGPLTSALSGKEAGPEAGEVPVPLEELEEPEPEDVAAEPEQVWEDEGGAVAPEEAALEAAGPEPVPAPPFEAPPPPPFPPPPPPPPEEIEPVPVPAPPRREDRAGLVCECGHARSLHVELTARGTSICLADVTPACTCRRFASVVDDTARLLSLLRHEDQFVRIGAVARLRGRPEADEGLLGALSDRAPLVRVEVVRALGESSRPTARRALIEVISQDPSPEVRDAAVSALAALIQGSIRPGPDGR